MRRREVIAGLGLALAPPLASRAQQAAKVARMGFLISGALGSPEMQPNLAVHRT
jgi:hypothetical protein